MDRRQDIIFPFLTGAIRITIRQVQAFLILRVTMRLKNKDGGNSGTMKNTRITFTIFSMSC